MEYSFLTSEGGRQARLSVVSPLAMFASAVSDGVGATMGAWDTCFEGPPPAMLASAVRWREDTACVESFYQSKVLGFSLLVVA